YRHLRDTGQFESYSVSNLVLKRDVGTLTLTRGLVSFAAPTMGRVVKAVFTGEGVFTLTPALPIEKTYMGSMIGKDSAEENFEKAVMRDFKKVYGRTPSQYRLSNSKVAKATDESS